MAKKKPMKLARRPTPSAPKKPAKPPTPKKPATMAIAKRDQAALDAIPVAESSSYLTENPLALVFAETPMKFSKMEEKILWEPVRREDIRIKPTGQPYVSHITYTRWLNRAFGLGQWYLRPLAMPTKKTTETGAEAIMVPYALYVRGKAVATAYGEHEYHPKNKDQSLGDAVESTHASALRRCCKRLGVALEMWDKEYIDRFVDEQAILVRVKRSKWDREQRRMVAKVVKEWRLRSSRPFPGELGPAGQDDDDVVPEPQRQQQRPAPPSSQPPGREPARPTRPVANYPSQDQPITEDLRDRFWHDAKRFGRTKAEVAEFLKRDYGLSSSHQIKRRDYEDIMAALEHPGPLAKAIDVEFRREPGEEG